VETHSNLKPWQPGRSGNPNGHPVGSGSNEFIDLFPFRLRWAGQVPAEGVRSFWPTVARHRVAMVSETGLDRGPFEVVLLALPLMGIRQFAPPPS
jgi:hypothetical protein